MISLEDLSIQSARSSQGLEGWATTDLRIVSHVKRFTECLTGDPKFREQLKNEPGESRSITASRGIRIDPMELACFWRNSVTSSLQDDEELRSTTIGRLWADYLEHMKAAALTWNEKVQDAVVDIRFKSWLFRQRERYKAESLDFDRYPFSIVSFELSKGCSLNCWFCGLAASKLEGIFPHTVENERLWRGALTECADVFGAAAQSGLCYTGTEPLDNPDYLEFLDDFRDIVGAIPRTTTALALRDLETTRKLLMLTLPNCPVPSIPCRFSILSAQELRRIHEAFSPEELLLVPLRQQQKGSLEPKVSAGKLRGPGRPNDKHGEGQPDRLNQESICCLTGFLVNMVDRTIKLVSPVSASVDWPLGYRIHFESPFSNAEDFGAAVRKAIEECMPESLRLNQIVSFRRDLAYERSYNGFRLTSPTMSHTATGNAIFGRVGDRVQEGNCTLAEIIDLAQDPVEYTTIAQTLNALFNQGLLEENVQEP